MSNSQMFAEAIPDLKSIRDKGRPRKCCPNWYAEGLEQADLAYQINTGWKLTALGRSTLKKAERKVS